MEIKRKTILISFLSLALACAKEEVPENKTGQTVFEVEGSIDEKDIHIVAGKNDKYMFSTYEEPLDTVIYGHYSGKIGPIDEFSLEKESIEIIFTSKNPGIISKGDLEEILLKPSLNYASNHIREDYYEVNFTTQIPDGKEVYSYRWEFGDGKTSTLKNPSHIYRFLGIPKYHVCLDVTFMDFCTSSICTDVFMPNASCYSKIIATSVSDSMYTTHTFSIESEGQQPLSYIWVIDNQVFTDSSVEYSYSPSDPFKIDLVKATVTDANNCTANIAKNVSAYEQVAPCMVNFEYDTALVSGPENQLPDDFITVLYTSPEGTMYSSRLLHQSEETFFNIVSEKDYKFNEKGQKTKIIELEFSCDLYDEDGNKLELRNAKGTIAVAHP